MRLLEEQKRRLEKAIQIADDFKTSDAVDPSPMTEQRLAEAKMSEEEVAAALEKEEGELAELEKKVYDMKKELAEVRSQIAAKKGEPPRPESRTHALKDVPSNPAAEKWLEENLSGIHKSIADQGEKLQAILAEVDKCEKNVSRIAQLRTRRLNCKVRSRRGNCMNRPRACVHPFPRAPQTWHIQLESRPDRPRNHSPSCMLCRTRCPS